MTFTIPELGVKRSLLKLDTEHSWYCGTTVWVRARRMDFSCSNSKARVFIERDILFLESRTIFRSMA